MHSPLFESHAAGVGQRPRHTCWYRLLRSVAERHGAAAPRRTVVVSLRISSRNAILRRSVRRTPHLAFASAVGGGEGLEMPIAAEIWVAYCSGSWPIGTHIWEPLGSVASV